MNRNKNKSLVTLAVVLVALAAVAVILANPFAKPKTDINGAEAGSGGSTAKVLISAKKDAVTAVGITPPGATEFKLEKDGDSWKAAQGGKRYKADQDKVDKILEGLPGLTSESLASSNVDKYKDYGLDDATAVKVGIYTGSDKPATTLSVGNSAPGSSSSFVRVGDDKEVWRTVNNVKALVGFTFKDYRTKKPWDFDPQIVKKLTVRAVDGPTDVYTFDNGVWKTASGTNANQNLIVKLLEDWSKATISEFADDVTAGVTTLTPAAPATPPADASGKPAAKPAAAPPAAGKVDVGLTPNLTVETPSGTYSFTLGEKDSQLYYVADQDKLVYKISEPSIAFYRNLKFDELKLPAAEDATKTGTPPVAGAPGANPATPGTPVKPGTPPMAPPAAPPAVPKPGTPPATPPPAPPVAPPAAPKPGTPPASPPAAPGSGSK